VVLNGIPADRDIAQVALGTRPLDAKEISGSIEKTPVFLALVIRSYAKCFKSDLHHWLQ
jgi:hypothetical protein